MFTCLTSKSDANSQKSTMCKDDATELTTQTRRIPSLLAATLAGALLLTGCQQPSEPSASDADSQPSTQADVEASKPVAISDSAAARIEQFQPSYVVQMQGLQRRLQAEYESLQAADSPDSDNGLLTTASPETTTGTESTDTDGQTNDTAAPNTAESTNVTAGADTATQEGAVGTEINTSTEVGERDLEVLKRISLEPREPEVLTEAQIIERYQQATQALYQPANTALSAQDIDTLLNIATLLPQLFEHTEIAERLSVKSPALARIIVQHQVWKQIEAQQALDMQQMKLTQQQEFETLMAKFNDTIKDYDAQIAKYERLLQEFQD